MNCPTCGTKMQGEQCPVTTWSGGIQVVDGVENFMPARRVPSAIYRCEECDAEYQWLGGNGGRLTLIDGGLATYR